MKNHEKRRNIPLKRSFKAQFSRLYIFFGTQSSNLRSILKQEVDIDGISAHAQWQNLEERPWKAALMPMPNPPIIALLKPEVAVLVFTAQAQW